MTTLPPNPFRPGGTLRSDAVSYIEREADAELLAAIQKNDYAYFFAAPQSGKSSLIVHTREKLAAVGDFTFVRVDLGAQMAKWTHRPQQLDPRVLESLFIEQCAKELGQPYDLPGSNEELKTFFQFVLRSRPGRVLVFIDEVNSFKDMPGSSYLFSQVRQFWNLRAEAATPRERDHWERLQFVITGFVLVQDLVKDPRLSPFNVSRKVRISDLTVSQTTQLVRLLAEGPWRLAADEVAHELHRLAGGSVHLSQLLLSEIWTRAAERRWSEITPARVREVSEEIIALSASDSHFIKIQETVARDEQVERAARRLADSGRPPSDESLRERLRLTGITNDQGTAIRNEIYRRVFSGTAAPMSLGRKTILNIGVVIVTLADPYQAAIVHAACGEAQERGWNVLVFAGTSFGDNLFNLIRESNISALVVMTGAFHLGEEEVREFCDQFETIPVVTVAMRLPGDAHHSVVVDNRKGVHEMMEHLVDHHGYRRIAFIRGPDEDYDARERFESYKEALADWSIPFDPNLVLPGTFLPEAGRGAIVELLDRGIEFDAVFAANDAMAIGALDELSRRGETRGVVGFDDMDDARAMSPALTTIEQPLSAIGRQAVRVAHRLADRRGEPVGSEVLTTTPRFRESCGGCKLSPSPVHQDDVLVLLKKLRLPVEPVKLLAEAVDRYLSARSVSRDAARNDFVLDVRRALVSVVSSGGVDDEQGTTDPFVLTSWHHALIALTDFPHRGLNSVPRQDIEELREHAWGEIIAAGQRVRLRQNAQSRRLAQSLSSLSRSLFAAASVRDVADVARRGLPSIGVASSAIIQYDAGAASAQRTCLVEFDAHGSITKDRVFSSGDLTPGLVEQRPPFAKVVLPLRVKSEDLGYMVFDLDPRIDGALYHEVSEELSAALYAAQIRTEHQQYALTLEGLPRLTSDLAALGSRAGTLHEVLERCAKAAKDALRADLVAIYEWQAPRKQEAGRFVVDQRGPPRAGNFHKPEFMTSQIYPLDRVREVLDGGGGFYGTQRYAQEYRSGRRAVGRPYREPFSIREDIKAMAALVLQVGSQKVGVMFVNYRKEHDFSRREQAMHRAFATAAAIAIRQKQVTARAVTETRGVLDKVLSPIVEKARELTEQLPTRDGERAKLEDFVTTLSWLANAYTEREAAPLRLADIGELVRGISAAKGMKLELDLLSEESERTAFAVREHLADVVSTLFRLARERRATQVVVQARWARTAVLRLTLEDNGDPHPDPDQMFELTDRTAVPWNDGRTPWWCRLTMLSHGAGIEYKYEGRNRFELRLPGDRDISCW